MTKNERIERMLVLANRLNAIVAELTAKKRSSSAEYGVIHVLTYGDL